MTLHTISSSIRCQQRPLKLCLEKSPQNGAFLRLQLYTDFGLTAQVPSLLDRSEGLAQDMLSGSAFSAVTVHLYLRHSGAASLTDVTLSLDAPPGLHLDQV